MATVFSPAASPATIDPAFLREIQEVSQELTQLLANIRDVCSSARMVCQHPAQLVDMLVELRDQLALHFALEEAYGFLEDPSSGRPLVDEATGQQIHAEHRRLYLQASRLSEEAELFQFEGDIASILIVVPLRFQQLDQALLAHEHHENEIVQCQYDEFGVGD